MKDDSYNGWTIILQVCQLETTVWTPEKEKGRSTQAAKKITPNINQG